MNRNYSFSFYLIVKLYFCKIVLFCFSFLSTVISARPWASIGSAAGGGSTGKIISKKLWRPRSKGRAANAPAWNPQVGFVIHSFIYSVFGIHFHLFVHSVVVIRSFLHSFFIILSLSLCHSLSPCNSLSLCN